ncbi:MAG: type II toxin-antitoxin system HicB family antitoxin [Limisphaerales bacterium]
MMKCFTLTAVFRRFSGGYAARVEGLPGASSPGRDPGGDPKNLSGTVKMVLEFNRQHAANDAAEGIAGADEIREPLSLQPT